MKYSAENNITAWRHGGRLRSMAKTSIEVPKTIEQNGTDRWNSDQKYFYEFFFDVLSIYCKELKFIINL